VGGPGRGPPVHVRGCVGSPCGAVGARPRVGSPCGAVGARASRAVGAVLDRLWRVCNGPIAGRPKAKCVGLPRAWMHEHNGLSARMVLYSQRIASASAGALGEAAFNRLQGSTGEANSVDIAMHAPAVECQHGLSANMGMDSEWVASTLCTLQISSRHLQISSCECKVIHHLSS